MSERQLCDPCAARSAKCAVSSPSRLGLGSFRKFAAPSTRFSSLSRMPQLKEGDAAPPISLETDSGQHFDLTSLKGENVVLYFYPKADTPGCTKEACAFRDTSKKFTKT